MATPNHTNTLKYKKKNSLVTPEITQRRQNGGEDSFLGTVDKATERHSVAMPMKDDDIKLRSLQSTWLTAQPDPKKTKQLQPTLMKVVKDFPGKCSPEQMQNYIAKVFGDASVSTATSPEITWALKCTVKQLKMATNGRSCVYCQAGVLLEDSTEIESMQKLKTDLKDHEVAAVCKTDTLDISLPITEALKDMPVTDPQKTILVLEVWGIKKEKEGNLKRMTSSSSLNESGDKFAGRVFFPLRGVQLDGEERELTLLSHTKKHKRGEILVHLSYKPTQVTGVSSAMLNYGHLFKLLVFHESKDEHSEKGHMNMWSAKLSPQARYLLLTQAISNGLIDLQCIAIELGALMDYHGCYTVQWGAFLSLIERIESNLSATSPPEQPPIPADSNQTSNWPPELQHELMDLHKCIREQLCAHLHALGTRSEDLNEQLTVKSKGQQKGNTIADLKGESINVLQTVQKLYMLSPFAESSGGTVEDCIRTSIEDWFVTLSSSLHISKDHCSNASALRLQAEACIDTCHAVQKHIVAVFKEFGVSYYSIFIQVVGSKLSELCHFCISEEKSIPLDKATAILYYQAYLACRQIEKCASEVNSSFLTLNIWRCYEPVVGSWIEAACVICKERIKGAVDSDTVVKVTDGAYHSSSAVDVAVFLHQTVAFWKSLNWPDAEQAFGYALAHFQNICHCTEDYAKTIYKRLNTKDLSGQSFEKDKIEKVCIIFNNMAHLCNQLNAVSEKLDMDSLYTRLSQGQNDAKKSFDRLKESTKEDIEHRIVTFVEEYSKTLAPDIQTFVTAIMTTGHETSASLEALRDHLSQSLQAFGDYLLDEVFQIILARVWSTVLKCFQAVLPDIQKGQKGQVQGENLYLAVLALQNFFFAEGNGLTGDNLENPRYKHFLNEIGCKRLATSDLVLKCCAQLSQCRPQSSTIGELSISVQYVEERSVLEVNILTAKLLIGTKKDGSTDTFVQVWIVPQMALQDTKTSYKTDLKKGTLTPKYDKELQIPAKAEELKRDGALLALAVYHTDTKHIAGLCLVPCQDIPITQVQGSCAREWVLPLFVIQDTSSAPLRELLVRQAAHDSEAAKFYKFLHKKLHIMFRSSPS